MRKVSTEEVADTLLGQLLFMKGQRPGTKTKMRDSFIKKLIVAAKDLFIADTSMLNMEPPVTLVGGMYAHFYDLLVLFETYGHPPAQKYLFLGDIIGKGKENVETLILLLCYKVLYPNNICIIRGYNELDFVTEKNGFKKEVVERFGEKIYDLCIDLFSAFPVAAVIASKIFCANCGIAPEIVHISQLERINTGRIEKSDLVYPLFTAVPHNSVEYWCEGCPPEETQTSAKPQKQKNGLYFGLALVKKFLEQNNLELFIRSHDVVGDGYEFPFEGDECFLTISTVPSYEEKTEKNGCVIEIDNTLKMSFRTLRPLPLIYRDYYVKKEVVVNPKLAAARTGIGKTQK